MSLNNNKRKSSEDDTSNKKIKCVDDNELVVFPEMVLYRTFSLKHVPIIYESLLYYQMDLNATDILIKYKHDIKSQFLDAHKCTTISGLSKKQKAVLLNIFKAIRLFRLSRTNLISNRLYGFLPYFNMDILRCISSYLC